MAEFGMTETHIVVSAEGVAGPPGPVGPVGPQGPKGDTGNTSVHELRGTGFPEGVVTASPGTYYTDTAVTNGAVRWVKVTGVGSLGWQVIYGDTGRRDLTASVFEGPWSHKDNGGSASRRVTARRQGNMVTFTCLLDSAVAGGAARDVIWLPNGFKNTEYSTIGVGLGMNATAIALFSTTSSIARVAVSLPHASTQWAVGQYLTAEFSFRTGDPWPTTLPGTPA